jgi:FkbM family methyltransferase
MDNLSQHSLTNVAFPHEKATIAIPTVYEHKYHHLFPGRPSCEAKFRQAMASLIPIDKNIIDAGAWIGDNALPWAQMIQGTVYAIDPSPNNCLYVNHLAKLNGIKNVRVIQAALSDSAEDVSCNPDVIDHINFVRDRGAQKFSTTTLDVLLPNENNLGLIHLDVESMEYKVVLGAANLIERNQPIVAFEIHIETDQHAAALVNWFEDRRYTVCMVNEVLPGCNLDCRNFIAFPRGSYQQPFSWLVPYRERF